MKNFLLSLLAVAVAFLFLLRFPPTDHFEVVVIAVIAFAYTLGWTQMLVYRRHWPLRSLGIFWTAFADALFWAATLAAYLAHWGAAWVTALIVAAFLVGGPLYAAGVAGYLWRRRKGRAS